MPRPGTDPKTDRFEDGGRVIFGFLDNITTDESKQISSFGNYWPRNVPWYAELTLEVKDVAVLLKSGLFWSEDNIDLTNNFFVDGKNAPHPSSEWINPLPRHGRYYELIDSEPAQWHGTLMVRAHVIGTLYQFRPSQLSLANVRYVSAKNPQGRTVYQFDSADRDRCFNSIFDVAPLKGWWPWPKKEGIDDASTQEKMDDDLSG
ncbi:hypothetical protein MY11210_003447 [Beauveria gryllotalpidicola]